MVITDQNVKLQFKTDLYGNHRLKCKITIFHATCNL